MKVEYKIQLPWNQPTINLCFILWIMMNNQWVKRHGPEEVVCFADFDSNFAAAQISWENCALEGNVSRCEIGDGEGVKSHREKEVDEIHSSLEYQMCELFLTITLNQRIKNLYSHGYILYIATICFRQRANTHLPKDLTTAFCCQIRPHFKL